MKNVVAVFCVVFGLNEAFSQVSDDFSDGNLTENPAWVGDLDRFLVNAEGELQSNGLEATDQIHLATASARVADTEWRLRARYASNPSGSNLMRFYLVADAAELEGTLNGYFVGMGETGSDDSIDLFRQDGDDIVQLIDGPDGRVGGGIDVHLRVRRDAVGNWTLEADPTGGEAFERQGTATDATYASSAFIGLYVAHTSTRNDAFFFDDLFVGGEELDETPPQLVAAEFLSNTQLQLGFDEALDPASAEMPSNYALAPGLGAPLTAELDANDPAQVLLRFGSAFQPDQPYQLSVAGVADLAGNVIQPPQQLALTYVEVATATFKDILINEVFPDPTPAVGLPEAEYLELYNRSSSTFDLADWEVDNGTTTGRLPAYLLAPGQYLILTSAADLPLFDGIGPALAPDSWPALVNGGDDLSLRKADGTLIDQVSYTDGWYVDADKSRGGYSLELINPDQLSCPPFSNWRASEAPSGGTPGTVNSIFSTAADTLPPQRLSVAVLAPQQVRVCFDESMEVASLENVGNYFLDQGIGAPATATVANEDALCVVLGLPTPLQPGQLYTLAVENLADCSGNALPGLQTVPLLLGETAQAGDVILNELLPDPTPPVGLPEAEYVELYNRSTKAFDLAGWTLDNGATSGSLPAHLLLPGDYVILTAEEDVARFAGFGPAIAPDRWPSLVNGGDDVNLRDEQGLLVDGLTYEDSWYGDPDRADGGYSLERIQPESSSCPPVTNWRAAEAAAGGTPGAINSVFSTEVDLRPPQLQAASVLDSITVQLCFDESMDAASLEETANYLIDQGIGGVLSAAAVHPDLRCVRLRLAQPLETGVIYTLSVERVADCSGNLLEARQTTELVQGIAAEPFEVVINELFPDPDPQRALPEVEFVELYNRTDKVLDLSNGSLTDGGRTANWESLTLLPGEHLILCAEENAPDFQPFGRVLGLSSFPSLGNTTDSLLLLNEFGFTMDYVYYHRSWYRDPEKSDGGWTLERIDPDFVDCNQPGNWRAAADTRGGTPGAANSLLGTYEDKLPPQVEGVLAEPEMVQLFFDEQMDPGSLSNVDHYAIAGIGTPLLAFPVPPTFRSVQLLLSDPLAENTLYELSFENLHDCAGNELAGQSQVGIPQEALAGDVLINEILFNPETGGSDFVEIYNASDKALDLSSLFIGEVDPATDSIFNSDQLTDRPTLLLPGQYLCLTADVAFQQQVYLPPGNANFLEMESFPSYDDREGTCIVFTLQDTLDRFDYLDDYHFPTLDDLNGVSLERLSLEAPTQDPGNWHSAASTVNFATPGYENSQGIPANGGRGAVSLDKTAFSPNGDGVDDVLVIRYNFDFPGANARITVFDSHGRPIRVIQQNQLLGTEPGLFTWDGRDEKNTKADIGIYVLLVEVTNQQTGEKEVYKLPCVVADVL